MNVYAALVLAFGVYVFSLSLSNVIYLRRATKKPNIYSGPLVSVLVPARNEESNLSACLDSLLDQSYKNYEIIILDDHSEDRTAEIAELFEKQHAEVRLIKGEPLPGDWNGKPFAMQQLAKAAGGRYLLFTDADTRHGRDSISWAVTNISRHGFDLLTGYPRHMNGSFGEKLVVPNMYLNTALFMPLWGLPFIPLSFFSHAVGQFLIFKAESFHEFGGYSAVRKSITEDIYICREMKKRGYKTGVLDAKDYVSCRMYPDFRSAVDGIGKNIFDFFEKELAPVIVLIVFIALFMLFPPVLMIFCAVTGNELLRFLLAGVIFFTIGWAITLYDRKQDFYLPFLYPLLFIMIIIVAVKSISNSRSGKGYLWKGRILK
jgi:chlorobactene glucosyltransferase